MTRKLLTGLLLCVLFTAVEARGGFGRETNRDWSRLTKFVLKFAKQAGLFQDSIVKEQLRKFLGEEYKAYLEHDVVVANNFRDFFVGLATNTLDF